MQHYPDSYTVEDSMIKRPVKKLRYQGAESIFKVRKELKTHFKILYIAMVFGGMALVWYGIWKGVQAIPIVSNPVVAMALGLTLLGLTGRVNKLE
jgi:hypothetical protein